MDAIVKTDFNFPGQVGKYVGKVRDVYDIDGKYLVMVVLLTYLLTTVMILTDIQPIS